tara:strand:- start:2691 stop:2954 length:264 start_codon:yes stop_codon:yes gene_type:complete
MIEEFRWHKVNEKERKQIKRNSEKLLNEFSIKLEKIKSLESHYQNEEGFREGGDPWKTDSDFRDLTFLNAPLVEGDSLVAEKGSWKK